MKKKTTNEAIFKSFDGIDLSKIPGSATEILTTNFERFNYCKSAQDVIALCHELFDNAKLDTAWTNKFFYQLDQIVENNPNPRRAYEQALLYVNNARMRGMGLGMNSRRFHEKEEPEEILNEGWIGGILGWIGGGIAAGLLGIGFLPTIALVGISIYGGNKIQKYFENKSALKNLDDSQIALLTALAQAKDKGLTKNDIEKICKAAKEDSNSQLKALDKLVEIGVAVKKGDKYLITLNGRNALASAGFKQDAFDKDVAELQKQVDKKQLSESMDNAQKEEFKKKLRAGEVKFKYKKKDGSERSAVGTMDPKLMDLPEKKTQSDVDGAEKKKVRKLPEDSVFYYDLEAKGFRSFKMANFIGYAD